MSGHVGRKSGLNGSGLQSPKQSGAPARVVRRQIKIHRNFFISLTPELTAQVFVLSIWLGRPAWRSRRDSARHFGRDRVEGAEANKWRPPVDVDLRRRLRVLGSRKIPAEAHPAE